MKALHTALLNKALLYLACSGLALGATGRISAQVQPSPTVAAASSELPDSPGTAWAKAQDVSSQPTSAGSTAAPSAQRGVSPTADTEDQPQTPQRPVGTAAAEAPKVSGIAAAQPAGVAIAPAKQRRVRTIVLKVGAMVGAGVAVGTVIALTEATSSKPPGAH
jgi:hypothetical protein